MPPARAGRRSNREGAGEVEDMEALREVQDKLAKEAAPELEKQVAETSAGGGTIFTHYRRARATAARCGATRSQRRAIRPRHLHGVPSRQDGSSRACGSPFQRL